MGNLTVASKSLGCDRSTIYEWIKKENLQDAIQEGRDSMLDLAENKLAQNIKEGKETSLIFFLKTQGKERGYVERKEHDHNVKGSIPISKWADGETNTESEI